MDFAILTLKLVVAVLTLIVVLVGLVLQIRSRRRLNRAMREAEASQQRLQAGLDELSDILGEGYGGPRSIDAQ